MQKLVYFIVLFICANGVSSDEAEDMEKLRKLLATAKNVVVFTGSGLSVGSEVNTFINSGGKSHVLYMPYVENKKAFRKDASTVWIFYEMKRQHILPAKPNLGHYAIACFEKHLRQEGAGRNLTVVTHNIDDLHSVAGSTEVIELQGNLFKTICTRCDELVMNKNNPICTALIDDGFYGESRVIPLELLPRCNTSNCGGLLRPYLPWLGKSDLPDLIKKVEAAVAKCDLCLVIGPTPDVYKYPAQKFAIELHERGVPVAEFNLDSTLSAYKIPFVFEGHITRMVTDVFRYYMNTQI